MHVRTHQRILTAAVATLAIASTAVSQIVVRSTHDWPTQAQPTADTWVDVATPEPGREFAVGATQPLTTGAGALFSGIATTSPAPAVQTTQVVVVRGTDSAGQVWQRYFHGDNGSTLSSYPRAISVALAATDADTRIAICGETFAPNLPAQGNNATSTNTIATNGFVAVYDGLGTLLWSYLFFGTSIDEPTSVQDVSIRSDGSQDFVTYCGMSANGVVTLPDPSSELTPVQGFLPPAMLPASQGGCGNFYASGSDVRPAGQWDGFVGRLDASHANGNPARAFHSVVGGDTHDGLVSLVELDDQGLSFATCGWINGSAPQTNFEPPLTRPYYVDPTNVVCPTSISGGSQIRYGYVAVFNTAQLFAGLPLILTASTLIGTENGVTEARDIAVLGDRIYVAGMTTAPDLVATLDGAAGYQTGYQPVMLGTRQGFVASAADASLDWNMATFLNTDEQAAAIGITGWSSHPHHIYVTGWTERAANSNRKIYVTSILEDANRLQAIRSHTLAATGQGIEAPGSDQGPLVTMWDQLPQAMFGLRAPSGAIAVDEQGRVTVVGATTGSMDWPVIPPPPTSLGPQPGHGSNASTDAVLASVDMLPPGVARTDGTGRTIASMNWQIGPGFSGGTTTSCSNPIQSMLIDYVGSAPAQDVEPLIVLDQPPDPLPTVAILQLGLAGTPCAGAPALSCPITAVPFAFGAEYWGNTTSILLLVASPPGLQQLPLGRLPASPLQVTVQFATLLGAPCSATSLQFALSPALMITY